MVTICKKNASGLNNTTKTFELTNTVGEVLTAMNMELVPGVATQLAGMMIHEDDLDTTLADFGLYETTTVFRISSIAKHDNA